MNNFSIGTRTLSFVSLMALLLLGPALSNARCKNLLVNSDFESDRLLPWVFTPYNGVTASGDLDSGEKHGSDKSFRITNKTKKGANVYAILSQVVRGLKPDTEYRLSAWVKGVHVENALIGGGLGWKVRKGFPRGTYEWTEVSTTFTTGPEQTEFQCVVLSEGPSTANSEEIIWVDDLELVEASEVNTTRIYVPTPFDNVPASARFYPIFPLISLEQSPPLFIHRTGDDNFGAEVRMSRDSKTIFFL